MESVHVRTGANQQVRRETRTGDGGDPSQRRKAEMQEATDYAPLTGAEKRARESTGDADDCEVLSQDYAGLRAEQGAESGHAQPLESPQRGPGGGDGVSPRHSCSWWLLQRRALVSRREARS